MYVSKEAFELHRYTTEGRRVTDNELLFSMIIVNRGSGKARLQLSTLDTGSQELIALK